jgi:hypothetical protein
MTSSSSPRKTSLETLAQNCFIPHDLKTLYRPFENCEICGKRPMDAYFLKGECYCQAGTIRQEIIICARCLEEYDSLSNYVPKLVVSDKLDSAEDIITKSCESAASKFSPDSLDFYDVIRETFHSNAEIQYYFNHDIANINPKNRRLWRLRYHVWKQYKF